MKKTQLFHVTLGKIYGYTNSQFALTHLGYISHNHRRKHYHIFNWLHISILTVKTMLMTTTS